MSNFHSACMPKLFKTFFFLFIFFYPLPTVIIYHSKRVLRIIKLQCFRIFLVPTDTQCSCGQLLSAMLEISLRDILQLATQTVSKSLWLKWTELGQTGCGAHRTHSDVSLTSHPPFKNPKNDRPLQTKRHQPLRAFLSLAEVHEDMSLSRKSPLLMGKNPVETQMHRVANQSRRKRALRYSCHENGSNFEPNAWR